ncbi:Fluconazole resistance protein 1 [Colletotrichum fructicola]|uniref:Cycloheximide resistance protein n=1 Tax=Colletotrichum fructicola (strain Nara gc5) TaxID=1213859 RepID=L2G954_COLFN|nr:Fluconazole resistance protein 1 [Colletotrichum fructicola Nara gc5]KAF4899109.1 Fluconazole resistance protein 1 [Colletotrichum fructicola]KAF4906860.1 Fluconazole resistance protein 1 [Colletotrichum fructicola]KAF4936138.1 Fluconazole resistance protein 1 [Colletotrichum fructicola]
MSSHSRDFFVDTPIGYITRCVTKGSWLKFPEDDDGYQIPSFDEPITTYREHSRDDAILVGWYEPDDNANPHNWSTTKKAYVYFVINYANAAVYLSSSIFAASQEGVMAEFHVSHTIASLGLALFVLGYGFGPLIFSPLADVARIGRNPPYLVATAVYLVISVLAASEGNVEGLMVLRFLQGFFGAPMLTSGGASLSDISSENMRPLALYTWACSGFAAASLAPVISGFAVPVMGWRWALWELVLANAPVIFLLLCLPETSASNILYARSQRLSRIDPSRDYRLMETKPTKSTRDLLFRSLVVPWQMHLLDPSIMFTSVYAGCVYGIYYSFFEILPTVYEGLYGFSMGQTGLVYLSIVIAVVTIGIPYCFYTHYWVTPAVIDGGQIEPEKRLIPAVLASLLVPLGMFIFAWTSREDIHWMAPTIGVALTAAGLVIILQCIFVYISLGYPDYAASAFAGNGFVRCLIPTGALLWFTPLYDRLGVAGGSTLLGGLCILGVVGMVVLYKWGGELRKRSRFAR